MSEPVNLAYLCHHYGEAYEINMRRGRYEARRRDDGAVLTADSADALLDLHSRRLRRSPGEQADSRGRPPGNARLPVPARGLILIPGWWPPITRHPNEPRRQPG